MTKFVFTGSLDFINTEDKGKAKIGDLNLDQVEPDDGLFVRIQSWSEQKDHHDFESLMHKKIRVTIEVLESNENAEKE